MRSPVRNAGFLLLAVAAVAVFVVLRPKIDTVTPTLPSSTSYESLISSALAADTANNLRTEGAPQQQVVNGWTAKDLLTIIAKENIDILKAQGAVVDATGALNTTPFDERIPVLLLIGVLALCWTGLSISAGVTAPRDAIMPTPPFEPETPLA